MNRYHFLVISTSGCCSHKWKLEKSDSNNNNNNSDNNDNNDDNNDNDNNNNNINNTDNNNTDNNSNNDDDDSNNTDDVNNNFIYPGKTPVSQSTKVDRLVLIGELIPNCIKQKRPISFQ